MMMMTAGMKRIAEEDQERLGLDAPRDFRELLSEAFEQSGRSKSKTAEALGINRSVLDMYLAYCQGRVEGRMVFEGWEPPVAEVQR